MYISYYYIIIYYKYENLHFWFWKNRRYKCVNVLWCLVGWKNNKADTVPAPITSLTQHRDLLFPLLCLCGSNIRFANMAYGFNKKGGAKTRHEQTDRNNKASKNLKWKPRWTDSFPKASQNTCHLFFPHYPVLRNSFQCFPCTAHAQHITASKHVTVTLAHFVSLRVRPTKGTV